MPKHESAAALPRSSAEKSLARIIRDVTEIADDLHAAADRMATSLDAIDPSYRASAVNLVQYLALRRHDMRSLQDRLAALGLSSLGRSESHVESSVTTALANLHRIQGTPPPPADRPAVDFLDGEALLARHTDLLLGTRSHARRVRIMVTAPSESADNGRLVHDMLEAGMDCLRLNCAHDSPEQWSRIIAHLRTAEQTLGQSCRVMMDLAGPKLRTGPVESGPPVIRWRPRRDAYGRATEPARIWLTPADGPEIPPCPVDASLSMPGDWLAGLTADDAISLVDAREANRALRVSARIGSSLLADGWDTAYVTDGTQLVAASRPESFAVLADIPRLPGSIVFHAGETLVVTRDLTAGHSAIGGQPAAIGCTLPEVFASAKPGERIWFDDGTIGGTIAAVTPDRLFVTIIQARPNGSRLRAEKGINLPDTNLNVAALTEKDLADLPFVARHADCIGLSFVGRAADVEELQARIAEQGDARPGIVLKIETLRAFESLPELILAAMRNPSAGIMIARGDLAVELGYERLAEVQEEILWIAEAAHLPVIWATQVLESLAQTGIASRSEITDAAMGERAECVMLNKGPHIVTAIELLDGILRRMQTHQRKKRSLLRRLRSWTPDG